MRFGLALPQYGFSLPDGEVGFDTTATWARRAEELGFDSVWLSDHFFYTFTRYGGDPTPIPAIEPMTALAGLAAITSRVRLGTLVLCAPFRHPALMMKMAVTIDRLSGGRLDLGLGAGWLQEEFDAFGFPFGTIGDRFTALEDALVALSVMQSGEAATYAGANVSLRDAEVHPAPVNGRVPVWVGGKGGPRLLRLIARYADGWNLVWRVDPDGYAARVDAARAAFGSAGRDPASLRLSVGLYTLVGADEAAARAAFDRGRAGFPGGAMDADTWETWRADTLSGTPDQVVERVQRFEELGVEELVISPWVLPFAVNDSRSAQPVRRTGHGAAPLILLMEPLEAIVAVLGDADEPLHWTVIQDRALRQGLIDPFVVTNVRATLLRALRDGVRAGTVVRVDTGVYALPGSDRWRVGTARSRRPSCEDDRGVSARTSTCGPPASSRWLLRGRSCNDRLRASSSRPACAGDQFVHVRRAQVLHEVASRRSDGHGFRGRLATGVADEDRLLGHHYLPSGSGIVPQDIGCVS